MSQNKFLKLGFSSFFFVSFLAVALEPENLERLNELSKDQVSFTEMRPVFSEIAKLESKADRKKTVEDIVAELQSVDPDYATRIAKDEDFWKLSYLLDKKWDITKKNSEGHNLLVVVLAERHFPNIDLVLKEGGWKLLKEQSNNQILAEAGLADDDYLRNKLKDWENDAKRKALLVGEPSTYAFEGISQREKAREKSLEKDIVPAAPMPPARAFIAPQEEPFIRVDVPYATNRSTEAKYLQRIGTPEGASRYFSFTNAGQMSYGVAHLTIPKIHREGELNERGFWELTNNPAKHLILQKLTTINNEDDFFKEIGLRALEQEAKSRKALNPNGDPNIKDDPNAKDLFVYIHGFNVDFSHAMRRTAQIMYDMQYPGLSLAFSWPAHASTLPLPSDFRADVSSAASSVVQLKDFLTKLHEKNKNRTIHLVAHSLGTRVLSQALVEFAKSASPEQLAEGTKKTFGEVILAAPAIDAQTFVKKWAVDVAKVCDKVSIFASDDDIALKVQSLAEDEGFSFPLGLLSVDRAAFPEVAFNFDLSDLTEGTFSLDHSVYAAVKPVIDHMGMILKDQPTREDQISLVNKAGFPYLLMLKRFDFFTPVPPARTVWKFLKI